MSTIPLCIRISVDLVEKLDRVAKENDRSRNYIINKILKEKTYELTGDC